MGHFRLFAVAFHRIKMKNPWISGTKLGRRTWHWRDLLAWHVCRTWCHQDLGMKHDETALILFGDLYFKCHCRAFLPCAGGCGVLVRSCLRSAPVGVGFWSVPVWGWLVGWFGLVVFFISPFLLGLCGLFGGLRPFVSLVWSCWHLLRRLPFTSARSTWGPFTSQSPHKINVTVTGVFWIFVWDHRVI